MGGPSEKEHWEEYNRAAIGALVENAGNALKSWRGLNEDAIKRLSAMGIGHLKKIP